MSLTGFIVKKACPIPQIESFNKFLFIGPHPDDIEVGAGATVAKLTSMGKDVSFLICTDGRFGYENLSEKVTPKKLTEIRKCESVNSAGMLGVKNVIFLNLSDGGLYSEKELSDGIMQAIAEVKPEIVFCPDPDVINECHTDHLNVGNVVKRIAFFAHHCKIMESYGFSGAPVKAVAFYMTDKFNCYSNTSGFLNTQLDALFNSHLSQFPEGCADRKSLNTYLKLRAFINGAHCFCRTAEGFRVLGLTHMHCLPEAGE